MSKALPGTLTGRLLNFVIFVSLLQLQCCYGRLTAQASQAQSLVFRTSDEQGNSTGNPNVPVQQFYSEEAEHADVSQLAQPQCTIDVSNRFDCFPERKEPKEDACIARGCCWDSSRAQDGAPYCYFSQSADSYRVTSLVPVKQGNATIGLNATLQRNSTSAFPKDIKVLQLFVYYETNYRVRFKILDPAAQRYEVPLDLQDQGTPTSEEDADYTVTIVNDPFGISINRKIDGQLLFDSRGMAPVIFSDQYLQIGTQLSTNYIYGLGQHRTKFMIGTHWQKLIFWTRDEAPEENVNLYGSHPFYLNLEPSGKAHGVFLLNSNAMQTDLQPYDGIGSITYRILGGIMDFFVFLGPSPEEVVQQYINLIGNPFMPPFWSLGFQLCKHGYGNSSYFWDVIQRNRAARMPYDVQWNDLDYSEGDKIWTWNNDTYRDLPTIIQNLHDHGQRNVIIVDPGISSSQPKGTYAPYDLGLEEDLFIKNASGQPIIGQVWPGDTVYVDFFNPKAFNYWMHFISTFHDVLPFDGLWIDMNEPSNFLNGSIYGCTDSSLDHPQFVPPDIDGGTLYAKTICPSSQQAISSHYNLHSLYGWSEMIATAQALEELFNKRAFVLSRSTAPGSGYYGAHWTGDNLSSFVDAFWSIAGILNSNIFGMTMVGVDICGFRGDATRELCIRWMQLGAFYPFSRNHAEWDSVPQDPGSYDTDAQNIMRSALETRYSLLPYLYTRFFISHKTGVTVVRPLIFDYPGTELIDRQFLWGQELLISPVLEEKATTVEAFIPPGSWFDIDTLTQLNVAGNQWHNLSAPLEKINVHVRGGSILPMVAPEVTTTLMRQNKIELLVAPDLTSKPASAAGELYWDDGESLQPLVQGEYSWITFKFNETSVNSQVQVRGYGPVTLGKVKVMGITQEPQSVTLDGQSVVFLYHSQTKLLTISGLSQDLLQPFHLTWQ